MDDPTPPPSDQGFDTMSLATLSQLHPAVRPAPVAPEPEPTAPVTRIRAVPEGTEARGFALYVGIDEAKAEAAGTDLPRIVEAVKRLLADIEAGRVEAGLGSVEAFQLDNPLQFARQRLRIIGDAAARGRA